MQGRVSRFCMPTKVNPGDVVPFWALVENWSDDNWSESQIDMAFVAYDPGIFKEKINVQIGSDMPISPASVAVRLPVPPTSAWGFAVVEGVFEVPQSLKTTYQ